MKYRVTVAIGFHPVEENPIFDDLYVFRACDFEYEQFG